MSRLRISDYELIVVDDCSTDRSVEISREKGARVLKMSRQSGPGGARNFGAQHARGEVLFFVDADVVVKPDTLERVAANFMDHPEVAAVFGSYDDEPAEKNFISQYKNLFHRFVHQQARSEAETFWAGCGAIRRDVFLAVNGFDAERYPRPAIEDIELGYRMRAKGHRILLDKQLQAKHLKRWTLKSMLHADIFCRAVPWSMLIFESKGMVNDLNLQTTDRISAGLLGSISFAASVRVLQTSGVAIDCCSAGNDSDSQSQTLPVLFPSQRTGVRDSRVPSAPALLLLQRRNICSLLVRPLLPSAVATKSHKELIQLF